MIPLRDNIRSLHRPVVNIAIIVACGVVFIYQLAAPQAIKELAFRPANLLSPTAFTRDGAPLVLGSLVLSIFMHGGLLHIGGNMLFLWVFGDNVEDRMGHLRYLVFYLLCGVLATGVHTLVALLGASLSGGKVLAIPVVGASGAIAGVLGAYYTLFRGAQVRALVPIFFIFTIVNLPAGLFIIIWFIMQLFSGVGSLGMSTGVAFWAHIGGFVAGLCLVRLFVPPRRRPHPRVTALRID